MKLTQILVLLLLLWIPNLLLSQARSFRDFIVAASSPTNPKASATNFKTAGGKDRFLLEEWGKGWCGARCHPAGAQGRRAKVC